LYFRFINYSLVAPLYFSIIIIIINYKSKLLETIYNTLHIYLKFLYSLLIFKFNA